MMHLNAEDPGGKMFPYFTSTRHHLHSVYILAQSWKNQEKLKRTIVQLEMDEIGRTSIYFDNCSEIADNVRKKHYYRFVWYQIFTLYTHAIADCR